MARCAWARDRWSRQRTYRSDTSTRQCCNDIFQFVERAREEVIASLNEFQAPGLGELPENLFQHFLRAMLVNAFAEIDASEIEAQHHAARAPESAGDTIYDLVVHGPAEERMRMADETGFDRFPVFRFFEQSFQATGGTADQV